LQVKSHTKFAFACFNATENHQQRYAEVNSTRTIRKYFYCPRRICILIVFCNAYVTSPSVTKFRLQQTVSQKECS